MAKTTDELVKKIAPKTNKKKENNEMKKSIIIAVVSVILTLAVVYSFYAVYQMGVRSERNRVQAVKAQVETAVNQVSKQ
jgi:flagellar basal body-associated protein FliL